MHRIAWLTDPHLNFVEKSDCEAYEAAIVEANPDSILLGGDIGEAQNVAEFVHYLDQIFQRPLFLVLGNHDFYHGSIEAVRNEIASLANESETLHFLTRASAPMPLTDRVALVGHDGWADAREGDYNGSLVMMNDYRLIEELAQFTKQDRLKQLHRLGDEAASHVRDQLTLALPDYEQVFVLTHVPPFRSACWYQGKTSDDEWAPHFVCQAMGRAILDVAAIYPSKEITVLCGHTHSPGECQPASNVRVITGGAEYGVPEITQIFDLK